MIRQNKWKLIISTAVTLLPMVVGLILWDKLPERVPTHWNGAGEIDGWSGRPFAVFAIPGFMAGAHLLCVIMTSLDPKVKDQTGKVLGMVLWICPFISVAASGAMYAAALGVRIRVTSWISLAMAVLFIAIGNYLPKCRRNYTIGIKVPWALESEANWNATHRMAGKLWVVGGVLMLAAFFLPERYAIWAILPVTLIMAVAPVAYSYIFYKKHGNT